MDVAEALAIAGELTDLHATVTEVQSPNGRWDLLQKWLKQNPDWKELVEHLATLPEDDAYNALKDYICEECDIRPSLLRMFVTVDLETKAKTTIAVIQECYRERAELKPKRPKKVGTVEKPTK